MKKTRYVIATGIMVLGLLSLLIGMLIHKNATTEGQHMNSTNYDSFQPGDRVTVGYDFIVGAKDLGGGLHFAVFLDEDANVHATYAVKNYEAGAKEILVSEEGMPYDQFTGKIFALTEKQADAVYPTANMFNKVMKEHNPDASILVDEELRASIKYGIKLYSKTDARPFIYVGWVLFTAGGVALLYMLLRLRFSREVTPAILSILVPVAGAIWWLVHARELGKFSFVRLFKGLRLLFLNYTVMEPSYQCMMLLLLLSLVVLAVLYPFCRRKRKRRKLWAISCGIPCLMAAVYAIANFVRGKNECTNERHIVFFVTALLILLWGLAIARTKRFKLCTAYLVVILLVAYTVNAVYIYTHVWSIYVANHTRDGWEKSFEKTIDDLSKAYILRDWKEIDFEALKEKYLPIVREAEETQDKAGFIVALYELKYDLAVGHVMVDAKDNKAWTEAIDRLAGNDYGLSMFRDKDGNFVAVMVEEQSEAESSGIKNGTIITKWDGVPVEEAAAGVRCVYHKSFAYAESEWLMQPVFLAGKGGDTVTVTFVNEKNGREYTVFLKAIGSYRERLDRAIDLIYREADTQQAVNYSTRMLNDHIGYLRITESQYDKNSTITTIAETIDGYSERLYEELREKLVALQDQGMDYLVIDLRGNDGGLVMFTRSVIGLFTDKEQPPAGFGTYKNGTYHSFFKPAAYGRGDFKDLPIVCLVNGDTASCGDIASLGLQRECGAVLAGMASTWGSAQGVGATSFLTDGEFRLRFPFSLSADFDGLPLIDPKADRKARFLPDLQLTFTRDEVVELFVEYGRDVELDKVIEYIETGAQ